ncbi:MAG TPA: phenylalanine--tRNA ligase subunit alpha [Acidobacteriota bacterium]|nr:phenylalanine--tRNA ligase subunit alpha [Acidobacteriota bacterium]
MDIQKLSAEFEQKLRAARTLAEVEELRNQYIGRKRGVITALLKDLPKLPAEERGAAGKQINSLKQAVEEALEARIRELQKPSLTETVDWSLPGREVRLGAVHPLTFVRRRIESIFREMGYAVADGPEIETDFFNFGALNFPPDHPARDTQDTLFIQTEPGEEPRLLRTHTSPVQIRTMQAHKPPVKILAPGRVYRKDEIDASHSPVFHQIEGLVVDEHITFSDLKGTLLYFLRRLFQSDVTLKFRPSFFPFTEPSAEVDVSCVNCKMAGCTVCKGSGWLEILGSGMVHPNVLEAVGYDSEKYTGFVFGVGIDRLAILLFRLPDIRLLYQNDIRFLSQFRMIP